MYLNYETSVCLISLSIVYAIYLPAQTDTWRFDIDRTPSYQLTVVCDDGKAGGTHTATTMVNLSPNLPPDITNLPREFLQRKAYTVVYVHCTFMLYFDK